MHETIAKAIRRGHTRLADEHVDKTLDRVARGKRPKSGRRRWLIKQTELACAVNIELYSHVGGTKAKPIVTILGVTRVPDDEKKENYVITQTILDSRRMKTQMLNHSIGISVHAVERFVQRCGNEMGVEDALFTLSAAIIFATGENMPIFDDALIPVDPEFGACVIRKIGGDDDELTWTLITYLGQDQLAPNQLAYLRTWGRNN
jgi:hypothetical protein